MKQSMDTFILIQIKSIKFSILSTNKTLSI